MQIQTNAKKAACKTKAIKDNALQAYKITRNQQQMYKSSKTKKSTNMLILKATKESQRVEAKCGKAHQTQADVCLK